MKIKISVLSGVELDWAVMHCLRPGNSLEFFLKQRVFPQKAFRYSTDWGLSGPIMENYDIYPCKYHVCATSNPNSYQAGVGTAWYQGETPLIAICRSIVATVQNSDEIEIPDELHTYCMQFNS